MTHPSQNPYQPTHGWSMWYSSIVILAGILMAWVLYTILSSILLPKYSDTERGLYESWRLAILTVAYYGPISCAQWMILRRYVLNAAWWIGATLGSVAVVYPASIWVLWTLRFYGLAGIVWLFGLGSGIFAMISQWFVLRWWTPRSVLWLVAPPVVLTLMGIVWQGFNAVTPIAYTDFVRGIFWGLYQSIMSLLLVYVLDVGQRRSRKDTTVGA